MRFVARSLAEAWVGMVLPAGRPLSGALASLGAGGSGQHCPRFVLSPRWSLGFAHLLRRPQASWPGLALFRASWRVFSSGSPDQRCPAGLVCGGDAVCCGSQQPVLWAERTRCPRGGTVTIFKEHTLSRPLQEGRGRAGFASKASFCPDCALVTSSGTVQRGVSWDLGAPQPGDPSSSAAAGGETAPGPWW